MKNGMNAYETMEKIARCVCVCAGFQYSATAIDLW